MRKILSFAAGVVSYGVLASPVFAQNTPNVLKAGIDANKVGGNIISPNQSIGSIVTFLVAFIIVIAFFAALLYIVIGALQWITSGGDKQKVADARNHIIAAIIGLIVVALSLVIINVIISALGLGSLTDLTIPTLTKE